MFDLHETLVLGKFCIIHIEGRSKYSNLKDVNEQNEIRIRQAIEEHVKQGGDVSRFYERCTSVPEIIDKNIHGIHIDPCYKDFTRILADINRPTSLARRSSKRSSVGSSSSTDTVLLFPDICYVCKKGRAQFKGKKVTPTLIVTDDAVESIKAASLGKNIYEEFRDVDLIAKELKMHTNCYREFTRGYTKKERESRLNEVAVSI